jgi:hypothetical protein
MSKSVLRTCMFMLAAAPRAHAGPAGAEIAKLLPAGRATHVQLPAALFPNTIKGSQR